MSDLKTFADQKKFGVKIILEPNFLEGQNCLRQNFFGPNFFCPTFNQNVF